MWFFKILWRCGNVGKTIVWNEKSLNSMVNLVPSRCYPQPLTVLKQDSWNSFAILPHACLILYRRKHVKSRSYSLQWNITHIGGLRKQYVVGLDCFWFTYFNDRCLNYRLGDGGRNIEFQNRHTGLLLITDKGMNSVCGFNISS